MMMILNIAWRNIWRNPVRSFVILLSVMLGLWAGTFVNALYYGAGEDRVRMAIENEVSHIQVHRPGFRDEYLAALGYPADPIAQVLQAQTTIRAWSFRAVAQGMLNTPSSSSGVFFYGVNAASEDSVTRLSSKIVEGSYFKPGKKHQILIGYKLAAKLKIKVRSKVVLSCLDTAGNISSAAFKVAGIYRSGNSARDGIYVYIDRGEMNDMLGLQAQAHETAILLKDSRDLDQALPALQKALPGYETESWKVISPETDLIISTLNQFTTIFMVIILMALSFGIVNTMLMAILERTREIGMIIALGMTRFRVFQMIIAETFMLVFIGCLPGLFLAWLSIWYFNKHGIDISSFAGKAMENFGFSSVFYPELPLPYYLEIVLLVVIAAVISALFPAIKAIRLKPAETLKA